MPARFDRLGISFQYPDNWTIDESDATAGRNSVTVYSPGGAFWNVTQQPSSSDLVQLAQAAVDAMPAFPADGCCAFIGDTLVVKVGSVVVTDLQ